jgi:dienelactone hydrolase
MAVRSIFRPWRVLLAALAIAAAVPAAHAQIRLDPAYADGKMLGPAAAKGAVIWSHGRSVVSEDSESPTPYYMSTFREGGWDTYRLNRMRDSDTLPDSSRALVKQVRLLKERGYRKVVLTGQSFGAFLALMAADASDEVDAVIATAPAAYGSFNDFYDSWRSNATKLYPLLESVKRARVMLFFFHGDDFDPGGRGERSRTILAERGIDHVVIDQPAFLTGHWAASTGLFVRRYGACMRSFVETDSIKGEFSCDNNWGQKPSAQLSLPASVKLAVASQPWRKENDFLGKWYGFYSNGREVLLAIERVRGNEVTAVYAVGPGVLGGQKTEWVRRTGRIDGDELIFKEKGRNTLLYRLHPDGRLAASWTSADGRTSMETMLRRTD